ncbi:GerMN domain-containing protein [Arthrobacter sp. Hz1]
MDWTFQRGVVRRRRGRVLATVVLISLITAGVGGCASIDSDDATTSLPQQASTLTDPSSVANSVIPPATATSGNLLPVYWLGDNEGDLLLYREFIEGDQGGDPIAAAIQAMTASSPLDPDYFGSWSPASTVSASISPDNIITVDISSDAFGAGIDEGSAYQAIQQLVYTATAAAANAGLVSDGDPGSVVVLVDGVAGFNAFGQIELGGRMQRDAALIAPIWIIEPQHGEVRDQSTITVAGSAVSEVGVLHWRISAVDGAVLEPYRSGTVRLDDGPGSPGPFEFTIALLPGEYEISVFDRPSDDPSGPELNTDTKRITVQ